MKIANQPSLNYWMREKEYKAIKEHLHQNVEAPVTPEIIDAALEKGRQIVTVVRASGDGVRNAIRVTLLRRARCPFSMFMCLG